MNIYIAGPDVFFKNAVEIGQKYKKLCSEYGFCGLYPLDNECDNANEIYSANTGLIDKCDIVIANGNPFRGEIDAGTAFEIGYAVAKKKRVLVYMDDVSPLVKKFGKTSTDDGVLDENGMSVENFGLPVNLMIAESSEIVNGTFEDCLKRI